MSARSTPEQNDDPLAANKTTRIASSRLNPSSASRIDVIIACVSALRFSGRLRTIRPMPSAAEIRTCSWVIAGSRCALFGDRVDFELGIAERLEHLTGVLAKSWRSRRRTAGQAGHLH